MPTRTLPLSLAIFMATSALTQAVWANTEPTVRTPAAAAGTPISVRKTQQMEFVSKVNGHRYSISVALPFEAAPAEGYGVLYVLDGYAYFGSATEIARSFGNTPGTVVVVGIGYPEDPAYTKKVLEERGPVPAYFANLPPWRSAPMLERNYDLTLPATDAELEAQRLPGPGTPKQKSTNFGGVDAFLKTIETEIKPRVEALAHIDRTNQALFGHSYGGLATLHALFVEPNAFRTFIVASPSIWYNNRAVLADEPKFAAAVRSGQAQPRVLVTMGGDEDVAVKFPKEWGIDEAGAKAYYQKVRMVENGRELVTRLQALHGGPGYLVESYAVFDKESHAAAPWSALARGVPFAFSRLP